MRRAPVTLALVGALLASTGVSRAAPVDVVPVHGGTGCKTSPPHVLRPGRAPLSPLRFDLTGIAHRSQTTLEVETFATRIHLLDGKWHSTTTIRKITSVSKGQGIARGQVGLVWRTTVSFPGTKTTAGGGGGTFSVKGHTDALSGGLLGGAAGNDRFPVEPVGPGASWRIVTCDAVDEIPAKETRTYTVRSVAHGMLVLTWRDVVALDPAKRGAGSQKIGKELVRFRLDKLRGSATGTYRVPLTHGLASESTQVTRVRYTFHAISANIPATPVEAVLVDTRRDKPAG